MVMTVFGCKQNVNENYEKIKDECKKRDMTLIELCEQLGITRQHLHKDVHDKRLKNKYFDKIESILDIELERYNVF